MCQQQPSMTWKLELAPKLFYLKLRLVVSGHMQRERINRWLASKNLMIITERAKKYLKKELLHMMFV